MIRHKPVKSLGQVFLKNENLKKKIADLINNSEYSSVLEIGPGLGAITQFIDFDKKKYFAVEIDSGLATILNCQYPQGTIIEGDFLDIDISALPLDNKVLLFGNIPYYISTPILLKFLKHNQFPECFLMVQKEYFEMLKAPYATKQYSSLSVLIQSCCEVKRLFNINRLNFFPKPKIDSIFFSLFKKDDPIASEINLFAKLLRICFSMPRKTLYNNLRKTEVDIQLVEDIYIENELDKKIRSEEIDPEKYKKLFFSHSCKKFLEAAYKVKEL